MLKAIKERFRIIEVVRDENTIPREKCTIE
jgi:hypothetical protein